MMNEALPMIMPFTFGLLLGVIFFGGLWWTIRKGLSSPRPGLLFLASAVLRMGIVVTGFYFISDHQWQRILACLVGFIMARLAVTLWTSNKQSEEKHAP